MIPNVLLIFVMLISSLPTNSDTVKWNKKRKLTWDDFQAKAPMQDPHAARSRVEVRYESQVDKNGNMTMSIEGVFIKEFSWVKPDDKKEQVLIHEQYHFNITEVWARKLRKEISNKKWNKKTLERDFNSLFKKTMNSLQKEQSAYDDKTNHSKERTIQSEWEKKIDADLNDLEAYSNTSVNFLFE